jgi:tetratricopeptide (TPR) repeat protein
MAQNNPKTKDPIQNVEEALTKTELFIEKNRNILLGTLAGVILIIGGFLAYKQYIVKPAELEAQSASFKAEIYFEKDSFNLALNGDKKGTQGFLAIMDEFGSTKTGNLAHYYAGICYLNLGKFQEAIDHLDKYDGSDIITTAMAMGAKGDALMEMNKTQEAIDQYIKAAGKSENQFSTPMYLMKAALGYEDLGNYAKSIEIYTNLREKFFTTQEGREADKYIARAQGILDQKAGK